MTVEPGVAQRAPVAALLIGQVCAGVVRAHAAVVWVSQRASVGRGPGGERTLVGLRGPHPVQTVHRVVVVGQPGRRLLMSRVSRVPVSAELQEGRLGRVSAGQAVRHGTHRHHRVRSPLMRVLKIIESHLRHTQTIKGFKNKKPDALRGVGTSRREADPRTPPQCPPFP
jgi:hypothetical protein